MLILSLNLRLDSEVLYLLQFMYRIFICVWIKE